MRGPSCQGRFTLPTSPHLTRLSPAPVPAEPLPRETLLRRVHGYLDLSQKRGFGRTLNEPTCALGLGHNPEMKYRTLPAAVDAIMSVVRSAARDSRKVKGHLVGVLGGAPGIGKSRGASDLLNIVLRHADAKLFDSHVLVAITFARNALTFEDAELGMSASLALRVLHAAFADPAVDHELLPPFSSFLEGLRMFVGWPAMASLRTLKLADAFGIIAARLGPPSARRLYLFAVDEFNLVLPTMDNLREWFKELARELGDLHLSAGLPAGDVVAPFLAGTMTALALEAVTGAGCRALLIPFAPLSVRDREDILRGLPDYRPLWETLLTMPGFRWALTYCGGVPRPFERLIIACRAEREKLGDAFSDPGSWH